MKRVLALVIFSGLLLILPQKVEAQTNSNSQSRGSVVTATVGQYRITITGYQSPYASIILKTKSGIFLASTTTDSKGYFTISNILINTSEREYCFSAVDFRRIGLSEACITIPENVTENLVINNVFLPPTIGLSKKQINAGQDALIYGYSMPGATVTLTIQGKKVTAVADASGYYSYTYVKVPAGIFTITAIATFEKEDSLEPTNSAILESLSIPEQVTNVVEDIIPKPPKSPAAFNFLPFLAAAIALLIAIGVLLYKLRVGLWVILIDFLRRRKKMHHDWFLDRW